ncbi:hypothetical protein U9M48_000765 [Paspalum notatum var. saurae]|uniref:Uncharacterized protein n=1 Tax=Paspalum notatum var. saurae TaxID=547442 RepID=A0AAQ3PH92_PASNO
MLTRTQPAIPVPTPIHAWKPGSQIEIAATAPVPRLAPRRRGRPARRRAPVSPAWPPKRAAAAFAIADADAARPCRTRTASTPPPPTRRIPGLRVQPSRRCRRRAHRSPFCLDHPAPPPYVWPRDPAFAHRRRGACLRPAATTSALVSTSNHEDTVTSLLKVRILDILFDDAKHTPL